MRIQVLTAEHIRNLRPLTLEPRERFNVFVGDNGQGKTNLLEAIYAVSTLRSFRTSRLADMIAFAPRTSSPASRMSSPALKSDDDSDETSRESEDGDGGDDSQSDASGAADSQSGAVIGERVARVGARVVKAELVRVYELSLTHAGRRVTLDGKAVRPLSKYFGGFNVVVFTPEDLQLPRGAPGDRRRFLDRAVFNARPEYLASATDYEKVLKQRNAILRMNAQGSMTPARVEEMLSVYDEQLATLGLAVANARAAYVDEIRGELARAFASITHTERVASARYASKIAGSSTEQVLAWHREGRMKDLATASTQLGPHRDDLAFELDEREAGAFASQGQLRAIMLAWKTAEMAVLSRVHNDQPILLLDDVSSELDPARNQYLFEHLATQAGQCFITTTHESHVLLTQNRANYRIENGQISS
jgi:DNA replication and repair protein RecF